MSSLRRVVAVPGRNLGPHVPQLLFPMFAAIRRGAEPTAIEWHDAEVVDQLEQPAISSWVCAQVEPSLRGAEAAATLLVGKSLDTYAADVAARLGVPAVWVTPLLRNEHVIDALSRASAPFLLVGGTADPWWDGQVARRLTPHVLELRNADHGLFVPGPLERSAENIGALAAATERFLDDVVWPELEVGETHAAR